MNIHVIGLLEIEDLSQCGLPKNYLFVDTYSVNENQKVCCSYNGQMGSTDQAYGTKTKTLEMIQGAESDQLKHLRSYV